jgi:hypothetical protein
MPTAPPFGSAQIELVQAAHTDLRAEDFRMVVEASFRGGAKPWSTLSNSWVPRVEVANAC